MADFVELAAEGFTAALETDMGDQALHFATNAKRRDKAVYSQMDRTGRSKGSNSSQKSSEPETDRRSRREPRRSERKKDDSEWSLKSYWRSKRHPPRQSSDTRRHEAPAENDWSRKSYWQNGRHQQHSVRETSESFTDDDESITENNPEEVRVREQRCDKLRRAKNTYVPSNSHTVTELKWEEGKLYDDVGRAVQDAMRKSGELDRRRPR